MSVGAVQNVHRQLVAAVSHELRHEAAAAAITLAHDRQTTGAVSSTPMTEAETGALAMVLTTLLDPMTLIGAMQVKLRDSNATTQTAAIDEASSRSERADRQRMEMLEKAQRALAKKARGMGKFAKKLLGAILTVVGTVASVFTGGASIALTVIGAVLLIAGEVVQFMADKGILDEKNGGIAAMVLKLVGAIVQTVASFGAGAGSAVNAVKNVSETAIKVMQTIKEVVDFVVSTLSTINGAIDMHNSVRQYQADDANIDADVAGQNADDANQRMADYTSELRRVQQRFTRVLAKLHATIEAQNETAQAALSSFA